MPSEIEIIGVEFASKMQCPISNHVDFIHVFGVCCQRLAYTVDLIYFGLYLNGGYKGSHMHQETNNSFHSSCSVVLLLFSFSCSTGGRVGGSDRNTTDQVCQANAATCFGDLSKRCNAEGTGYIEEQCDSKLGLSCGASGLCEGLCARSTLGESYIGCEYYATQMANEVSDRFEFAVSISNASDERATVNIEGGALRVAMDFQLQPGDVKVQRLPWVEKLKGCELNETNCLEMTEGSDTVTRGAYRIRSTVPVTVYQFNPLDYTLGIDSKSRQPILSFTNDASLLLPVHVWGTKSFVATYPDFQVPPETNGNRDVSFPGLITITASEDDTEVTTNLKANSRPPLSFQMNQANVVTLQRGDVLQLASEGGGDFTGSAIQANKPIQVMGGHFCTYVPQSFSACDHLEETMYPLKSLGYRYLVAAPRLEERREPRPQLIRIIAAEDDVEVTFAPAIRTNVRLEHAGDVVELGPIATDFFVQGSKKIAVAQYMVGQQTEPAATSGDPSMLLAIPVEQYRTSYLVHAPVNYENNWVNIIATQGVSVTLDGVMVSPSEFEPIEGTGYSVARVLLQNTNHGNHKLVSQSPFGVTLYGYGQNTSYWYPGGLDVEVIIPG